MRFLFYFLLIANVSFFFWSLGHRDTKRHVDVKSVEASGRLLLRSEVADTRGEIQSPPTESPPPARIENEPPAGEAGCYRMGPFAETAEARRVLALVKEWIDRANLTSESSESLDGYWLLYPKAENMDEAKGNRKMLMDKGIKDVWLIDKGEMAGTISLGIFKTREEAETEVVRLSKLNVRAQIRPRITQAETVWIQFVWDKSPLELDEIMIQLRGENPEVSVPPLSPCPSASPQRPA
ncbi:hypothetical protein [Methylococcus capsulatus]|uniref:hypothetical protein n=1 Tax=Methylococcus capsulatus TaxID=414 RepID=UPI00031E9141|nr:hypothetical protein [Methylococcus capsulatus]QXP91073.1 hypothetical protein KW114_02625 [Methylococcus capsulatus]